jgi:hypothetical protein
VAQAAAVGAGVRMTNGELAHFTIKKDGGSHANAGGIKLFSYWFPCIHDISISGMTGNGIDLPVDNTLNPNPDRYSCGVIRLDRCDIRSNTGWGVYAALWSVSWLAYQNYIVGNSLGGVYTTGAGHDFSDNAVAGNGTGVGSVGLHIAYGGVGTPHNVLIRSNEIDNNWGTQVLLEGYHHILTQNRFISDSAQGAGGVAYRASYGIKLDATASGAAQEITVRDNLFRYDNPAVGRTTTGVYIVPAAGATANSILNNVFSTVVGITKYNFPSNRARNLAVENGIQVAGSDQTPYGIGQVTVVTASSSLLLTATPQKLPYAVLFLERSVRGPDAR